MSLDDAEIARLRALCEAATEGPWEAYSAMCCPDMGGVAGPKRTVCQSEVGSRGHPMMLEDAEWAAEAANALPAALDEIERLRALLARGHQCPTCDARCYACSACGYVFG